MFKCFLPEVLYQEILIFEHTSREKDGSLALYAQILRIEILLSLKAENISSGFPRAIPSSANTVSVSSERV